MLVLSADVVELGGPAGLEPLGNFLLSLTLGASFFPLRAAGGARG